MKWNFWKKVVSIIDPIDPKSFSVRWNFFDAIKKGDLKKAEYYIARGVTLDGEYSSKGKIIFFDAIKEGDLEKVKFFVEQGIDLRRTDGSAHTPLQWAMRYSQYGIFRLLLDCDRLDINLCWGEHKETILMRAARSGDIEAMEMILSTKGINIDLQNPFYGNTALMYAFNGDHKEAADMLLAAGADDSLKNRHGETCYTYKEGLSKRAKNSIPWCP